jgi:hypothetical protein
MTSTETATATQDDVVIPDAPIELKESKRASARALYRSFSAQVDLLRELWQTIRAYRVGGKEIDEKLANSNEDAAVNYREAQEQVESDRADVDKRYEEAIAPFKAERDRQYSELDAQLKSYKDEAISELGLDADIPSKEEAVEAVNEWKQATGTIRTLVNNAQKRQNIAVEYVIPNITPKGVPATGTDAFRPRFSACSIDGKASRTLLTGDIAKEIGVSRDAFVKSLLKPIDGNREQWDNADAGYELEFTVGPINPDADGNGKTVRVNVVKAEPIVRGKSKEEEEDDAAADAEDAV